VVDDVFHWLKNGGVLRGSGRGGLSLTPITELVNLAVNPRRKPLLNKSYQVNPKPV